MYLCCIVVTSLRSSDSSNWRRVRCLTPIKEIIINFYVLVTSVCVKYFPIMSFIGYEQSTLCVLNIWWIFGLPRYSTICRQQHFSRQKYHIWFLLIDEMQHICLLWSLCVFRYWMIWYMTEADSNCHNLSNVIWTSYEILIY